MPRQVGFSRFAALLEEQIGEKISRRILSGDQGMVVWWSIGAGVHVEPHSHANEQIVWMLKGKMEFRLGSEQRVCGPGDVVVIPGGTEHEAWFHEDTEVIDFSAPPRDDLQTRLHERRLNSSLRLLTRVDRGLSKLGGRAARPGSFASYETGPHMRERASACRDPSSRGPRHPRCGTIPDTSAQRRVISDAGLRLPCAVNHRRPPTFTPQNLPKRM